ncbi:MAG: hypothetical protein ONA90_04410 [candidate division KSB1 bacterium]|nr:hypothetical protein [candidate division KSB1 bacterium]
MIELYRHLNEVGAHYVVIGGLTIIHYGYFRREVAAEEIVKY